MKHTGRQPSTTYPNRNTPPPWFIALAIKLAETKFVMWVFRSRIRILLVAIISSSLIFILVVYPVLEAIIYFFFGGRSGAEALNLAFGLLEAGAGAGFFLGLVWILLASFVSKEERHRDHRYKGSNLVI